MFTPAELRVVTELVKGESNKEIAFTLKYSQETVYGYIKRILRKSGAKSRSDFISQYYRAILKNKEIILAPTIKAHIVEELLRALHVSDELPRGKAS